MKLKEFDYYLPPELIAQAPAKKRDQSRLLVVNREAGSVEHSVFADIGKYLPKECLLVLNDTRVIPARLHANKSKTGGKLEVLLVHQIAPDYRVELDYRVEPDVWEVMIKGKNVRQGLRFDVQEKLFGEILESRGDGRWLVKFDYEGEWSCVLQEVGEVPLPPYIKGSRADDSRRYQTVYAKNPGAAAAPTAGLHFTPELLEQLKGSGIEIAWVTLNVGPGTFAPVRVDDVREHQMGAEYYTISEKTIQQIKSAKQAGRKIVSVGTTSTRTLESASDEYGNIVKKQGWTEIFIYPGYKFKLIDCLLTNFHLPGSTPLLMTCAWGGKELIMKAYEDAIRERYRFYSYGDSMLVL